MKAFRILFCCLVLVTIGSAIHCEEDVSAVSPDIVFDNLLRIRMNFWDGLFITQGDKKFTFGLFGNFMELEKIMSESDQASKYLNRYKSNQTAGYLFVFIGLGCLGGAYTYLGLTYDHQESFFPIVPVSLISTAFILEMIGMVLLDSSYTDLFDSVWEYNRYRSEN